MRVEDVERVLLARHEIDLTELGMTPAHKPQQCTGDRRAKVERTQTNKLLVQEV